jgi:hypothetical protein
MKVSLKTISRVLLEEMEKNVNLFLSAVENIQKNVMCKNLYLNLHNIT